MIQVIVKTLPLAMSAAEAAEYIGANKVFTDMRKAGWIKPLVNRNKMVLFDTSELQTCYARFRAEEYPEVKK